MLADDVDGSDTYVLGEINVSSVHPFPDDAPAAIARYALSRLGLKVEQRA